MQDASPEVPESLDPLGVDGPTVEPDDPLYLRYGGSLVEQLGAQLYPSVTATVAELISNAWDADADNVWVSLPFGDAWTPNAEIVVLDDGNGMTRTQAQHAYLIVGRKRRLSRLGDRSEKGRPVHGRKGIGKLAAFGTAGRLECTTSRDGVITAFALDYDAIRVMRPDQDYEVEPIEDPEPLLSPDGTPLANGTRVRLKQLRVKRKIGEDTFVTSMSRRFSIKDMKVSINGAQLQRFDIPLEFRFPRDGVPPDVELTIETGGWAVEDLGAGRKIRWWMGFTEKPLKEGDQQGVSILARSKLAQRPFKFERAQGTTAQLGQEYLVGEVEADWLDDGTDVDTDLIQSNRDQLQLEDARLDDLLNWGRRRLAWALRRRQQLRGDKAAQEAQENPELQSLLQEYTSTERRALLGVAGRLSKLPEIEADDVTDMMKGIIDSRSEVAVRELMERIEEEDDPVQDRMWSLVAQFGLIDARRLMSVIEARLRTIEKLRTAVEQGAKEVPEIHSIIRADTWLLDPRWHLLDDEVDVTTLPGVNFSPEVEAETGHQLDFLFALAPSTPANIDEVVVVEIKRGTYTSGKIRKANESEVNKFHSYVLAVNQHYSSGNTNAPRVRGLMVAEGYTAQADPIRKSLEQIGSPKLEFKTWHRVLDETHKMHLGWLAVSGRRAARGTQP